MDNRRPTFGLLVVIVLLCLPMIYIGCYFGRCIAIPIYQLNGKFYSATPTNSQFVHVSRHYRTSFEVTIFTPLGKIEALARGIEVRIGEAPALLFEDP